MDVKRGDIVLITVIEDNTSQWGNEIGTVINVYGRSCSVFIHSVNRLLPFFTYRCTPVSEEILTVRKYLCL